jgi:hypothetical protein
MVKIFIIQPTEEPFSDDSIENIVSYLEASGIGVSVSYS